MLEILQAPVVHGFQIVLDAERRLAFEHLRGVAARAGLVSKLGVAGREKRVVQMVGSGDAGECGDRVGIAAFPAAVVVIANPPSERLERTADGGPAR